MQYLQKVVSECEIKMNEMTFYLTCESRNKSTVTVVAHNDITRWWFVLFTIYNFILTSLLSHRHLFIKHTKQHKIFFLNVEKIVNMQFCLHLFLYIYTKCIRQYCFKPLISDVFLFVSSFCRHTKMELIRCS